MRKHLLASFAFVLFALTGSATAGTSGTSFEARVKLMEYAIQFEATHPVQTSKAGWAAWLNSISLNPSAEAYVNGQACLVLGFQSTFSGGLCKLSTATGASDYQSSCTGGSLPCNPAVFGKSDGANIFCASPEAGNQLSKSCAFQSFQFLDQKSGHLIPGFAGMTEANFNISKLDLSTNADALKTAAASMFSGNGASLDKAYEFTKELCDSIASGKKTGNQPQDLKTCRMYLGFLAKAKDTAAPVTQGQPVAGTQAATTQTAVNAGTTVNRSPGVVQPPPIQNRPVITQPASLPVMTNVVGSAAQVSCSVAGSNQVLSARNETQVHSMVNGLAQQQNTGSFAQLNACLKGLESQPEIPAGKKNVYWKQINGKNTFSMRCERTNDNDTVPLKYAFLTDEGYLKMELPKVTYITHYDNDGVPASEHVHLPRQNASFKAGSTLYYLDMDQGDSFQMATSGELDAVSQSRFGIPSSTLKYRVDLYRSKRAAAGMSTDPAVLTPVDATTSENTWVKDCVDFRVNDFLNLLLNPSFINSGDVPANATITADWNLPANSPVLAQRYGKSITAMADSVRDKILARVPACAPVINTAQFFKAFDKAFNDGSRFQNYNVLHNRIAH